MKYDYQIDLSCDNSASLILRRIDPGSVVLEFGPASGYMTRYMKEELDCRVYCIELDRKAAAIAEKYSQKMVIADLDDMKWYSEFQPGLFDYLIFADVLEHLKYPWQVLKKAVSLLKKNGTVISSIPNVGHSAVLMDLIRGNFDYRYKGLLDESHLRFFTKKSILQLLAQAGLCPVEWMATLTLPEDTEIKQSYTAFPVSLRKFLKNREDAHVYQFITVSKREEDIAAGECCSDFSVDESNLRSPDDFLQVFWEEEGVFNESNSVIVPIEGNKYFHYQVCLPPEAAGKTLRIDPGTNLAFVRIQLIELIIDEQTKKHPLASWSKDNYFAGLHEGNDIYVLGGDSTYTFFCTGNDPQLFLEKVAFLNNIKSLQLNINMYITHEPGEILLHGIRAFDALRIKQEGCIGNLELQLTGKEERLASQSHTIDCLQSQVMWYGEQINKLTEQLEELHSELAAKTEQYAGQSREIEALQIVLDRKDKTIQELKEAMAEKENQLDSILNSNSWKVTAPLRYLKNCFFGS